MTANFSLKSKRVNRVAALIFMFIDLFALTRISVANETVNITLDAGSTIKLNGTSISMDMLSAQLKNMATKDKLEILVETKPETNAATVTQLSRSLLKAGVTKVHFKNRESGDYLSAQLDTSSFEMPKNQNNYKYFEQNGKWGYADDAGNVLIEPTYDDAYPTFVRGLAKVKLNEKWGMIDTLGSIVVPIRYEELGQFEGERISFMENGQYGFLDATGTTVIPAQYDAVHFFFNGLAPVQKNGKWGFINADGDMVIQPRFDNIQGYMEGLAPVQQNGKWGFVNANDELVIPCTYQQVNPFMGGLASVMMNGTWGYINKENKMVIEPQFDNADFFYDSRASVQVGNKYGIIDKTGTMVVQPQYDMIANYHMGVCFAVIFEKPEDGVDAQNVNFDLAGNKLQNSMGKQ